MGYLLFLVIAFVMLGVERLLALTRPHSTRHNTHRS
jgi:hypothetical protein